MDGSVSNVQFTERRRGFDPDEVNNYLRHIDEKVVGLRTMAQEAVERAELAEERARKAEAELAAGTRGGDEVAEAAGVLSMAQKTADATLADARAKADDLVAAAAEDADRTRLSAEAEAQQLLTTARADLETRRAEHLGALRQEIAELAEVRDAVAADVEVLTAHLEAERSRVRDAAATLQQLAEDPAGLGAVAAPDRPLADVSAADSPIAVVPAADSPGSGEVAGSDGSDAGGALGETAAVGIVEVAEVEAIEAADDGIVGFTDVEAVEAIEVEGVAEALEVTDLGGEAVWSAGESTESGWSEAERPEAEGPDPVGGAFSYGSEVLFAEEDGGDRQPDGGDAGGLFGGELAADGSPLGPVDEEADEALRAFFEQEPDDDGGSSRWGFRRR